MRWVRFEGGAHGRQRKNIQLLGILAPLFCGTFQARHPMGPCRPNPFGVGIALWAAGTGKYPWILAAFVAGYAPAWFAHFFIEKNKPATFQHPPWSFCADFKMAFLMLTGGFRRSGKRR